jgi:AraC-like DNA-binding protein
MALARLQKVQPLLSGGALVKEVAVEAGYSKQTNFTREFKRYYKANPTDFRDTVGGFPGGILQKCPNSIKDVRFRLTNSVDRSGVTVVNR